MTNEWTQSPVDVDAGGFTLAASGSFEISAQ
jgi:hypothetical protein